MLQRYFTFHNVSINTGIVGVVLLAFIAFTFHNVSINTLQLIYSTPFSSSFTFHNVSINTNRTANAHFSINSLHIFVYPFKNILSYYFKHFKYTSNHCNYSIVYSLRFLQYFRSTKQCYSKKVVLSSSMPQNSLSSHLSCLLLNTMTESFSL